MRKLALFPDRTVKLETVAPLGVDPDCQRCNMHKLAKLAHCARADGKPGGLLVIGGRPSRSEEALGGRPFSDAAGAEIRRIVSRVWTGPVAYDVAIRCPIGHPKDHMPAIMNDAIIQCRPYLAGTYKAARASRVILADALATQSVLGRPINPTLTQRAYGFFSDGVPWFAVRTPRLANGNRFMGQFSVADFEWAATANPIPLSEDACAVVVENVRDSARAVAHLRTQTEAGAALAWDVETAGLMWTESFRITCVSVGVVGADWAYVWVGESLSNQNARVFLEELLADPAVPKGGANVKYDMNAVRASWDVRVPTAAFDTRLWNKLLAADAPAALAPMADMVGMGGHKEEAAAEKTRIMAVVQKRLGWEARPLTPKGKPRIEPPPLSSVGIDSTIEALIRTNDYAPESWLFGVMNEETLIRYNARDTVATGKLAEALRPRLRGTSQARVWNKIVRHANDAIADMEANGIAVSVERIAALDAACAEQEIIYMDRLRQVAPSVNFASSDAIASWLFDELKLPCEKFTAKGKRSTDKHVVEALALFDPNVRDLLWLRRFQKMRSTYAEGMRPHVRRGRIHPSILLDGAECMPAGELVLTSRGYLPVERVVAGDLVLTHMGRARPVVSTVVNPARPIVLVTLSNGAQLRTTLNHGYRTPTGWAEAGALAVGDVVVTHGDAEEWRDVAGWPYRVSSWGRVAHLKNSYALSPSSKRWGHHKVTLVRGERSRDAGNRRDFTVHRLVADAFGVPGVGLHTRHLNGIPWDNTVGNLVRGTAVENGSDARTHGTRLAAVRAGAPPKLSTAQVAEIRAIPRDPNKHARGDNTDAAVARRYGVTREYVRDIRTGERRTDDRQKNDVTAAPRLSFDTATVVSIVRLPAEVTYGLRVAEDNSHVTAGVVTHNTGRTSCVGPNLQNLPRTKHKIKEWAHYLRQARGIFVVPKGRVLVQFDYSQLELRVAAFMSEDPLMIELFNGGTDYHLRTAQLVSRVAFNVDPDDVTPEHRDLAKAINFGILYGKTENTFAKDFTASTGKTFTPNKARMIMDEILGKFSVLNAWCVAQRESVFATGQASTWWDGETARVRPLWRIAGPDPKAKSTCLNSAVNTPIQGTASDFCVASIAAIYQWLNASRLDARMVLAVHDSIMFDVAVADVDDLIVGARSIMQSHNSKGVPLIADVEIGQEWGVWLKKEAK